VAARFGAPDSENRLVNAGVTVRKRSRPRFTEGIIEELDQTVKFARESPYSPTLRKNS